MARGLRASPPDDIVLGGSRSHETPRFSQVGHGPDRRVNAGALVAGQGPDPPGDPLVISESGPDDLDIHGVRAIAPAYEASWNCSDRLISHAKTTQPNGSQCYDRDRFVLAEEWNMATGR